MSAGARTAKLEDRLAERGLPSNRNAETAILGSILIDGSMLAVAEAETAPEEFAADIHRIIFRAMRWLAKRGSAIDFITLGDALQKSGDLERVGGHVYLTTLTDGLPRGLNVQHYARIVRQAWRKRQLLTLGESLSKRALDPTQDAADIAREASAALAALEGNNSRAQYELLVEIGMERLDALARLRHASAEVSGDLDWGAKALDEAAPAEKGDLVVVGGLSSSGKSALSVQMALANGAKGRGGLVVSLEMSKAQQFDRAISMVSRIPYTAFRHPKQLSEETMASLLKATGANLAALKLGVADQPYLTVEDIAALARQFRYREKTLDFVMVDHAQIIEGTMRHRGTRADEVAGICVGCKRLAKQMGIVVVLLSQLRKDGMDEAREPRLGDFKDSGGVYENADIVLAIHRPYVISFDPADKGKEVGLLLKNRQGATARIPLRFDETTGRWEGREWGDGEESGAQRPKGRGARGRRGARW